MRVRAVLTAGLLSLSTVLVAAPCASAVANGSDVPAGQFGFVAKLAMTKIPRPDGSTYDSFCTGSLIAPSWLLTTGHCFHDARRNRVSGSVPYPTTVALGLTDTTKESGTVRHVTDVLQSPTADVALAHLDSAVTTITPLSINRVAPSTGQHLTLAGWGSHTETNPQPSPRMQEGTVEIATVSASTLGVRGVSPAATTSACTYDSGAPYFLPSGSGGQLVAVEATGPGCPHSSSETTSRADAIATWIADKIA